MTFALLRPDLIDLDIERAVAGMQSVVELGRYIRDIKVLPVKVTSTPSLHTHPHTPSHTPTQFPLPEVVVIHRDPSALDDLRPLESYILEELNVRAMVLAAEDSQYGIQLKGTCTSYLRSEFILLCVRRGPR